MKYLLKSSKLSLAVILLSVVSACSNQDDPKQETQDPQTGRTLKYTEQVTFMDQQSDPIITIDVAVADEAGERNHGLMDVNKLPADKGMLFIFENQEPLSFWMANTPLSLDIIFVNEDRKIVRIHHSTQPFSEQNFKSGSPAKYVIETNGGFCISHDIQEGMHVTW